MISRDAVKVVIVDATDNILVLRRSASHPYYPYHPDFPGGEVEPGETIEQAALRELVEETGISGQLSELQHLGSWKNHYGSHHHLYRLEAAQTTPTITISWEHDQHVWLPLATLLQEDITSVSDHFYCSIVHRLRNQSAHLHSSGYHRTISTSNYSISTLS